MTKAFNGRAVLSKVCNFLTIYMVLSFLIPPLYLAIFHPGISQVGAALLLMNTELLGWFEIVKIPLGFLLFHLMRKKKLFWDDLKLRGERKMTPQALLIIIAFNLFGQMVFTFVTPLLEWVFNLFGLSIMAAVQSATLEGNQAWSLLIYAAFVAPVFEEVAFRGAILSSFRPKGKIYAIVLSSLLFGIFHANIPQALFATCIGLVFAYVTIEYAIGWAIFLHIFNNFFLGTVTGYIEQFLGLPESTLSAVLVFGGGITAIITFILKRKEFITYIKENKPEKGAFKQTFTSIPFWIFLLLCLILAWQYVMPIGM